MKRRGGLPALPCRAHRLSLVGCVTPCAPFFYLKKPIDELRQSFVQPGGWIVTEQFSRFRNIRASQRHVAWLLRQLVNRGFFPERVFDCNDQIFELDRLALAQCKDIEDRALVLERGHRSLNYVVDVSVITSRGAVAKLLDRLTGVHAPRELMNRQVRPLPRTVYGEVTERYYTQLIKMRVSRAKKFARNFCRCVRTECLGQMLIFRKGHGLRGAVNG